MLATGTLMQDKQQGLSTVLHPAWATCLLANDGDATDVDVGHDVNEMGLMEMMKSRL